MAAKMITPENIVNIGFSALLNKMAPNLKKNMKTLDDSINNIIMSSLIRLGDRRDDASLLGKLGRIFGVNGDRKNISTERSTIGLKAIPFDTISKEALTNAIPGYLRQMLIQMGGPDMVYDYRSRSFKTKRAIGREFRDQAVSMNTFNQASSKVRKSLSRYDNDGNYSNFRDMVYDLLIEDMSGSTRKADNILKSFKNKGDSKKYIESLIKDARIARGNGKLVDQLAQALSSLDDVGYNDIYRQIVSNNTQRDARMRAYKSEADDHEIDLSHIIDSIEENKSEIIKRYTGRNKSALSRTQGVSSGTPLGGTDYTNAALFEIYRRLNKGINVYQVGSSSSQLKRFKGMGKLKPPSIYRPDNDIVDEERNTPLISSLSGSEDHTNILTDDTLTDVNGNPLNGKQKFGKWASVSGKNVVSALFRGNPEEVRRAFGQMISDISGAAARPIKSFFVGDPTTGKQGIFGKINDSFGNVTGYLKHKFMGTGYEYTNENGQRVRVSNNEKGGVIGYLKDKTSTMFKGTTDKTKKWFSDVAKYFDFRSDDDKSNNAIASKRKALLSASVGAMAGLGFIGGPFGLIMGAIAGSALQAGGIGGKIKEILFGKDYTDKKGNKKHKLGLVERAVNNIVDPIRYQVGKTFTAFGSVLKKNILGPLSNIGVAIRERMANAAGGAVGKAFNKVLGGAGWLIKNLLKIPLEVVKAPLSLLGLGARGGARAAGGVAGVGLNSIAKIIAGKNGRDIINDRISKQKFDAKMDDWGSGYYDGYKHWKSVQDEKRKNSPKFSDYISEQQEIIDASNKTEENTAKISEDISTLTHHATHHDPITDSSIYTSDIGLHERIDDMFEIIRDYFETRKEQQNTSNAPRPSIQQLSSISGSIDDSNDDSNALLGASVSMSDNGLSRDDVESISSIADESNSSKPNKRSILSRFKNLLKRNSQEDEEKAAADKINNDPQKNIFGKISSGIGKVGGILGDVFGFIKDHPILSVVGGTVIADFFRNFFGPNEKGKSFMERLDDTMSNSVIGKLYHGLTDKNGENGSVLDIISGALGHMITFLPNMVEGLDTVGGWVNGLINGLIPGAPMPKNPGGGLATMLSAIAITNMASGVASLFGSAGRLGKLFKGAVAADVAKEATEQAAKQAGKSVVKEVAEETAQQAAKSTISNGAKTITKEAVEQTAKKSSGGFLNGIKSIGSNMWSGAKNAVGGATTAVTIQGGKALDAVVDTGKYIGGQIAGGAIWLSEKVGKGWDNISEFTTKQIAGLKSFVTDTASKASSIAKKSWASISRKASEVGSSVKSSLLSLGDDITIIKKLATINLDDGAGIFKKIIDIMFDVGAKFGPALCKLLKFFTKVFGTVIGFVLDAVFNLFNTGDIFADKEEIGTIEYVSAGVAGAIAGEGNGIWDGFDGEDVVNALFNALKWGEVAAILVGAGGTVVLPVIGTVAGAVVGFVVGAMVGALISLLIGSDNIARFMDMVVHKVLEFFGGGKTAKGYGSGIKTISYNNQAYFPEYYQNAYSNNMNMRKAGCGPIAASYLANAYGKNISPSQAAKMLNGTSYRDRSGGTSADGIAAVGRSLGLNMHSGPINSRSIASKLSNGEPVAFLGRSNDPKVLIPIPVTSLSQMESIVVVIYPLWTL
jgi:histone H3/H4